MRIPSSLDEDDEEEENGENEDENGECTNRSTKSKSTDGPSLSFTPQQAHIFGGQSIFLSFVNIDAPLSEDIFYYVVFKGSKLQHITSAKVLNPYTLQAVIPDHNDAELVILSVYQYTSDTNVLNPDKNIMATDTFVYTSDSSQFLTQQLALNVDHSPNLLNLQNVYSSLLDIPMHEKKGLDYRLTASFRNLSLPPNWSLVSKTKKEEERSWTLLHFCAKYNFPQLAEYLLAKPGAKEALRTLDDRDRLPIDIANLTKHKKMMEVLSRHPCEDELPEEGEKEIKRPTVKRHKLGTTTFTNNVTEDEDITVKDLMILRELDALATTSKDPQKNGSIEMADEQYPLAESLKKLHEINEEIRRLRNINSQDHFERLDEADDCFGADMVSKDSIDTCNGEYLADENMNDTNKCIPITEEVHNDNEEKKPVNEEKIVNKEFICEKDCEISDDVKLNIVDIHKEEEEEEEEKPPKPERQHSNVSVNKVEMHVAENVEFSSVEAIEVTPVVEVLEDLIKSETVVESKPESFTDVTDLDNPGELPHKLESVTEETEEELDAAGTGRAKLSKHNKSEDATETQSLNELPPLPYKRVGVLRKSKKDRPLSDSFENLRMVENQGIIDFYRGSCAPDSSDGQQLHRGHSLDTLTKDLDDGNDTERSTTSVNECHGSQESVSSDSEPSAFRLRSQNSFLRERSDSAKSIGSQRTLSLLSLNDLCTSRHSSGYSHDEMSTTRLSKKSSSLFHRLSFKKAKSMTSLDMREKTVSKNDDRRKTITAGEHDDFLTENKYEDPSKDEDFNDSQPDMLYGDILVRCESYDDRMKQSKSPSLKKSSKGSSHHSNDQSDEDTDEGTSHEIGEQHVIERKVSTDDKQKRLFGILRSKGHSHKERKGSKEKKEEKLKERRDSEVKQKKKISTSKQEVTATTKSDSKSFLPKRGSSFRKPVADSKGSEKSRLMRGSASNSNPFNKRSSERKSPLASAKFNPQIPEIPEGGNDLNDANLLPLNKNLSSSQASLNSDSLCIDDDTDAPFSPLEEVEYDSDLDNGEEPETWSELVDKKVQRKMHAKDIKRQDVIYELIQTESQYVRILQIMKKIYWDGMMRHLNFTPDILNAMFPVLEDLIELNGSFLRDMKKEQESSENFCVKSIGNVILNHFDGENGKLFKEKYGYFCSHHLEAVALYKDFLKNDKKFQQFVKNCLLKAQTRRLSVPECITYVTIRMTKYPLLIEAIIKATKEASPDFANLQKSLELIKETLVGVDEDVEIHEQQKELGNLKKSLDSKNVVEIKTDGTKAPLKFRANKLFHKRSRLLYDKKVVLKSKNKFNDVRMIILADKIIFFQENSGKLQLLNVDNKMPVMSLKGVMVREVATDTKALFLMNTIKEFIEIYEIIFEKGKEKAEFMPKLEKFIAKCPDEEEENLTDNEEEARREEEERIRKLKELIEQLEHANHTIQCQLETKNKIVQKLIDGMEEDATVKGGSPCNESKPLDNETKPLDIYNARVQLEACLLTANSMLQAHNTTQINSSPVSSPGQNNINSNPQLMTKKADTFGGFDNRTKPAVVNNINRASSLKPMTRAGMLESEIAPKKDRRQSQLMQVLSRTKTMGSNEDLTSLSSTSTLSLSNFNPPPLTQLQVYQLLTEGLGSLVKVTNEQDLEIARMRYELQEARGLQSKTESELSELREKMILQQKDSERQLRNERENYAKLSREFKRNKEKNQKLAEQQQRHLKANSEEMIV